VGPDVTDVPRTTACPSCGASLRPDAGWCGQCYFDLRPAPAPEPVAPQPSAPLTAPATASFGLPVGDPLTQPLVEFLPPVPLPAPAVDAAAAKPLPLWTCRTCQDANLITELRCGTCGQSFLGADGDQPLLVLPGVGDISRFSRGQRAGLALGAVAAVLAPLALLTLLLTHRPPDSSTPASSPSQSTVTDQVPPAVAPDAVPPVGQTTP
jgi:hypothetical protein